MSLTICVNGKQLYKGSLGAHLAALTIHVMARWGRTRVSIAYVDNLTTVAEVIG